MSVMSQWTALMPQEGISAKHMMKNGSRLCTMLELRKGACNRFIYDLTCNDLPSIVLLNEKKINEIKHCCHQHTVMV